MSAEKSATCLLCIFDLQSKIVGSFFKRKPSDQGLFLLGVFQEETIRSRFVLLLRFSFLTGCKFFCAISHFNDLLLFCVCVRLVSVFK